MRSVVYIIPTIWTGGSGKQLRGYPHAQVLAFYFLTAPSSNMIGLYYQPLTTILHETGLTFEQFKEALDLVSSVDLAHYDQDACMVWVPESARYQIGETMSARDKRRIPLLRELALAKKHPFAMEFMQRYGNSYQLATDHYTPEQVKTKGHPHTQMPHPSTSDAPLPIHTHTNQPPSDLVTDQKLPDRLSLRERAELWLKDPQAGSYLAPNPEGWPEIRALCETVATMFKHKQVLYPRVSTDVRVRVVLQRLAEGYELDQLTLAVQGAARDTEHYGSKAQFQNLQTILADGARVDKFCQLAQSDVPAANTGVRSRRGDGPLQPDNGAPNPFAVYKAEQAELDRKRKEEKS